MSRSRLERLVSELTAAGCNPRHIAIQGTSCDGNDDVVRLAQKNGEWTMRYWERGQARQELFRSPDFDDAVKAYKTHVMSIQHWHMVAFTRDAALAEKIKKQLSEIGIEAKENNIPHFNAKNDYVFRLFVTGPEIFDVEKAFGKRILVDEGRTS